MIRLLLLALAAYIAWRLLNRWLAGRPQPPQAPPSGFTPDPEALVRCDRCGVRVPASQIDAVRRNCRQCGDGGG